MGGIWSETARFEQMLRVELAVARAQAARGLIPAAALTALETRSTIDVDRIAEIERTTDHDIIAFVSQVAESVGPEGRYLHLGLTSSDVVDTGLALQQQGALELERQEHRRGQPAVGEVTHPLQRLRQRVDGVQRRGRRHASSGLWQQHAAPSR